LCVGATGFVHADEVETAIGTDVHSVVGLIIQLEGERQGEYRIAIVTVITYVGVAQHDGIGARCYCVLARVFRHRPCGIRFSSRRHRLWHVHAFRQARLGHAGDDSLSQREWNCANGHYQKQVKGTSKKMRFYRRINLFFHSGVTLFGCKKTHVSSVG
jgi:hypothetical protein